MILLAPPAKGRGPAGPFLPYLSLLRQSKLASVHQSTQSDAYLSVVALNCLLTELDTAIRLKLLANSGKVLKWKLSDAQAVVLYKSLIGFPVSDKAIYLWMIRDEWVNALDHAIIANGLYAFRSLVEDPKSWWEESKSSY